MNRHASSIRVFFFNATATTEIYTLSLHDALPISGERPHLPGVPSAWRNACLLPARPGYTRRPGRSEEHTSELQSRPHLVCRLLLEKKKSSLLIICPARVTRAPRAAPSRCSVAPIA